MKAVRFGNYFTFNVHPFNLVTAIVTGSCWVHTGAVWEMEGGDNWQFEMQFRSGLVGPREFERVVAWANARPWRKLVVLWLPLHLGGPQQKWAEAHRLKGSVKGYAKSELMAHWARRRLGWEMPHDPTLMTCGELTSTLDAPEYLLLDEKHRTHDAVDPGHACRTLRAILGGRITI